MLPLLTGFQAIVHLSFMVPFALSVATLEASHQDTACPVEPVVWVAELGVLGLFAVAGLVELAATAVGLSGGPLDARKRRPFALLFGASLVLLVLIGATTILGSVVLSDAQRQQGESCWVQNPCALYKQELRGACEALTASGTAAASPSPSPAAAAESPSPESAGSGTDDLGSSPSDQESPPSVPQGSSDDQESSSDAQESPSSPLPPPPPPSALSLVQSLAPTLAPALSDIASQPWFAPLLSGINASSPSPSPLSSPGGASPSPLSSPGGASPVAVPPTVDSFLYDLLTSPLLSWSAFEAAPPPPSAGVGSGMATVPISLTYTPALQDFLQLLGLAGSGETNESPDEGGDAEEEEDGQRTSPASGDDGESSDPSEAPSSGSSPATTTQGSSPSTSALVNTSSLEGGRGSPGAVLVSPSSPIASPDGEAPAPTTPPPPPLSSSALSGRRLLDASPETDSSWYSPSPSLWESLSAPLATSDLALTASCEQLYLQRALWTECAAAWVAWGYAWESAQEAIQSVIDSGTIRQWIQAAQLIPELLEGISGSDDDDDDLFASPSAFGSPSPPSRRSLLSHGRLFAPLRSLGQTAVAIRDDAARALRLRWPPAPRPPPPAPSPELRRMAARFLTVRSSFERAMREGEPWLGRDAREWMQWIAEERRRGQREERRSADVDAGGADGEPGEGGGIGAVGPSSLRGWNRAHETPSAARSLLQSGETAAANGTGSGNGTSASPIPSPAPPTAASPSTAPASPSTPASLSSPPSSPLTFESILNDIYNLVVAIGSGVFDNTDSPLASELSSLVPSLLGAAPPPPSPPSLSLSAALDGMNATSPVDALASFLSGLTSGNTTSLSSPIVSAISELVNASSPEASTSSPSSSSPGTSSATSALTDLLQGTVISTSTTLTCSQVAVLAQAESLARTMQYELSNSSPDAASSSPAGSASSAVPSPPPPPLSRDLTLSSLLPTDDATSRDADASGAASLFSSTLQDATSPDFTASLFSASTPSSPTASPSPGSSTSFPSPTASVSTAAFASSTTSIVASLDAIYANATGVTPDASTIMALLSIAAVANVSSSPWIGCMSSDCVDILQVGDACGEASVVASVQLPSTRTLALFRTLVEVSWVSIGIVILVGVLVHRALPGDPSDEAWESAVFRNARYLGLKKSLLRNAAGPAGVEIPAATHIAKALGTLFNGMDLDPSDRLLGTLLAAWEQTEVRCQLAARAIARGRAPAEGGWSDAGERWPPLGGGAGRRLGAAGDQRRPFLRAPPKGALPLYPWPVLVIASDDEDDEGGDEGGCFDDDTRGPFGDFGGRVERPLSRLLALERFRDADDEASFAPHGVVDATRFPATPRAHRRRGESDVAPHPSSLPPSPERRVSFVEARAGEAHHAHDKHVFSERFRRSLLASTSAPAPFPAASRLPPGVPLASTQRVLRRCGEGGALVTEPCVAGRRAGNGIALGAALERGGMDATLGEGKSGREEAGRDKRDGAQRKRRKRRRGGEAEAGGEAEVAETGGEEKVGRRRGAVGKGERNRGARGAVGPSADPSARASSSAATPASLRDPPAPAFALPRPLSPFLPSSPPAIAVAREESAGLYRSSSHVHLLRVSRTRSSYSAVPASQLVSASARLQPAWRWAPMLVPPTLTVDLTGESGEERGRRAAALSRGASRDPATFSRGGSSSAAAFSRGASGSVAAHRASGSAAGPSRSLPSSPLPRSPSPLRGWGFPRSVVVPFGRALNLSFLFGDPGARASADRAWSERDGWDDERWADEEPATPRRGAAPTWPDGAPDRRGSRATPSEDGVWYRDATPTPTAAGAARRFPDSGADEGGAEDALARVASTCRGRSASGRRAASPWGATGGVVDAAEGTWAGPPVERPETAAAEAQRCEAPRNAGGPTAASAPSAPAHVVSAAAPSPTPSAPAHVVSAAAPSPTPSAPAHVVSAAAPSPTPSAPAHVVSAAAPSPTPSAPSPSVPTAALPPAPTPPPLPPLLLPPPSSVPSDLSVTINPLHAQVQSSGSSTVVMLNPLLSTSSGTLRHPSDERKGPEREGPTPAGGEASLLARVWAWRSSLFGGPRGDGRAGDQEESSGSGAFGVGVSNGTRSNEGGDRALRGEGRGADARASRARRAVDASPNVDARASGPLARPSSTPPDPFLALVAAGPTPLPPRSTGRALLPLGEEDRARLEKKGVDGREGEDGDSSAAELRSPDAAPPPGQGSAALDAPPLPPPPPPSSTSSLLSFFRSPPPALPPWALRRASPALRLAADVVSGSLERLRPDEVAEAGSFAGAAAAAYGLQSNLWVRRGESGVRARAVNLLATLLARPKRLKRAARRSNEAKAARIAGLPTPGCVLEASHLDAPGGALPFFVLLDPRRRAVVVSIRGTASAQSVITDLISTPADVRDWVPQWVRDEAQRLGGGGGEEGGAEAGRRGADGGGGWEDEERGIGGDARADPLYCARVGARNGVEERDTGPAQGALAADRANGDSSPAACRDCSATRPSDVPRPSNDSQTPLIAQAISSSPLAHVPSSSVPPLRSSRSSSFDSERACEAPEAPSPPLPALLAHSGVVASATSVLQELAALGWLDVLLGNNVDEDGEAANEEASGSGGGSGNGRPAPEGASEAPVHPDAPSSRAPGSLGPNAPETPPAPVRTLVHAAPDCAPLSAFPDRQSTFGSSELVSEATLRASGSPRSLGSPPPAAARRAAPASERSDAASSERSSDSFKPSPLSPLPSPPPAAGPSSRPSAAHPASGSLPFALPPSRLPRPAAQRLARAALASGPEWRVVVTGHSLGAAVACLVALHLREARPDAACYAYCPPGGTVSPALSAVAARCCLSVAVGKDVVSRASLTSLKRAVDEAIVAIARCRRPKLAVLALALLGGKHPGGARRGGKAHPRGAGAARSRRWTRREDRETRAAQEPEHRLSTLRAPVEHPELDGGPEGDPHLPRASLAAPPPAGASRRRFKGLVLLPLRLSSRFRSRAGARLRRLEGGDAGGRKRGGTEEALGAAASASGAASGASASGAASGASASASAAALSPPPVVTSTFPSGLHNRAGRRERGGPGGSSGVAEDVLERGEGVEAAAGRGGSAASLSARPRSFVPSLSSLRHGRRTASARSPFELRARAASGLSPPPPLAPGVRAPTRTRGGSLCSYALAPLSSTPPEALAMLARYVAVARSRMRDCPEMVPPGRLVLLRELKGKVLLDEGQEERGGVSGAGSPGSGPSRRLGGLAPCLGSLRCAPRPHPSSPAPPLSIPFRLWDAVWISPADLMAEGIVFGRAMRRHHLVVTLEDALVRAWEGAVRREEEEEEERGGGVARTETGAQPIAAPLDGDRWHAWRPIADSLPLPPSPSELAPASPAPPGADHEPSQASLAPSGAGPVRTPLPAPVAFPAARPGRGVSPTALPPPPVWVAAPEGHGMEEELGEAEAWGEALAAPYGMDVGVRLGDLLPHDAASGAAQRGEVRVDVRASPPPASGLAAPESAGEGGRDWSGALEASAGLWRERTPPPERRAVREPVRRTPSAPARLPPHPPSPLSPGSHPVRRASSPGSPREERRGAPRGAAQREDRGGSVGAAQREDHGGSVGAAQREAHRGSVGAAQREDRENPSPALPGSPSHLSSPARADPRRSATPSSSPSSGPRRRSRAPHARSPSVPSPSSSSPASALFPGNAIPGEMLEVQLLPPGAPLPRALPPRLSAIERAARNVLRGSGGGGGGGRERGSARSSEREASRESARTRASTPVEERSRASTRESLREGTFSNPLAGTSEGGEAAP